MTRIISFVGEQIAAEAKTRRAERCIKTDVLRGDYAEEILKAAEDFQVDMIIIESRGLGVLNRTVLGSVLKVR